MKTVGSIALATLITATACTPGKNREKPNVVVILVDDMGWKDCGCYGSTFYETPHIDSLAATGVRFTQAYSASGVCSPTRASILTGKTPARLHLTEWIGPDEWHIKGELATPAFRQQLDHSETTLAEALKTNGYTTFFTGKWHLGSEPFYPEHHGFDKNIGGNSAGAPPSYFYPYRRENWEGTGWPREIAGLEEGSPGEYLTDRLTREAEQFLDTIGNRPFLLYLSHYAIHKPLQAKAADSTYFARKAASLNPTGKRYKKEPRGGLTRQYQDHPVNAAMIKSVDQSVGQILAKLNQKELTRNTIVIFTSDNGPVTTSTITEFGGRVDRYNLCSSVLPLRAGKGWYYEGGIRVPLIIRWPGHTPSDSIITEPAISYDLYPTILTMCGIDPMPRQHLDGLDLSPILTGDTSLTARTLYWHYPHYHTLGQTPASAIRKGDYKLIWWYEEEEAELYDLSVDVSEKRNLADSLPAITRSLHNQLFNYLGEVDAGYPERTTMR